MTASRSDVLRLRLERHGLSGSGLEHPLGVVERMLAVQAQDLPAASWALAVRSPGSTAAEVAAVFDAGAVVRSYPLRGTLHIVPAFDLDWMLGLTATRLLASFATRRRQLGLDDALVARAGAAAVALLSGGRALSRSSFLAGLQAAGVGTDGQRGYHLIASLALRGVVVWGPYVDGQPGLTLLAEWVPRPRRLEHDEALGEFLVRYLRGHGPATLADFAWWAQLTVADTRVARAVAGDRLVRLEVDGRELCFPADAEQGELGAPPRQRTPVLALPGFDEYLLGYRDRGPVISPADFERVVPGSNGIFLPLILEGGRVTGTCASTPGAADPTPRSRSRRCRSAR